MSNEKEADEELISSHKLLVHSNDYKKTNALSLIYTFILFAISLGTRLLMDRLKSGGMEFAEKSLPEMIYYISSGLSVIFGLILIVAPVSMLRGFYIDVIEVRLYGIKIINLKRKEQRFISYNKFNLIPAVNKKNAGSGFTLDIKKMTLKKHLYFYDDFENPREMEENLKKYAVWSVRQ
ncbi:MAG: hypothetical protein FWC17_03715 [Treponema sp.]|nr:hypothetical protein [Treponema sp.]